MATHVFGYTPGWNQTVEYQSNDPRLPESVRAFNREAGANSLVVTPLVLGSRNLGWVAITTFPTPECDGWWRIAVARGDRPSGNAGPAPEPPGGGQPRSRNAARRSSKSETGSRATFTTTSLRGSPRF